MSEPIFNLETAQFDVTCHTNGCGNQDIVLRVIASKTDPFVVCGACETQVTDVTPITK